MINYFKHDQIDKVKWDTCVSRSANKLIYAYSWYLDVVSPGWEALVTDNYKHIMPLTAHKKWSIAYLYQPFFAQQLGVFSGEELGENVMQKFLEAIPGKYKLAEIHLNHANKFSGKELRNNRNIELSLCKSYEDLSSAYSESTKRNIKKACKYSLSVSLDSSLKEIIKIFISNRSRKVNSYSDKEYTLLLKLNEEVKAKAQNVLLSAHDSSGQLLGGILFFMIETRATLIFSAVNEAGRQTGAMHYMIDYFIRMNSGTSMILDFEGSNDESLSKFYKSFGSLENNYLFYKFNRLPPIIRWLK